VVFDSKAQIVIGVGTIFTALIGSGLGGRLLDLLSLHTTRLEACCRLNTMFTAISIPLAFVVPWIRNEVAFYCTLFAIQFCMIVLTTPINVALMESVSPSFRSSALGLATFTMHLFGDMPSTVVYGYVSDLVTARVHTNTTNQSTFIENESQPLSCTVDDLVANPSWQHACESGQRWGLTTLTSGVYVSAITFLISLIRTRSMGKRNNGESIIVRPSCI